MKSYNLYIKKINNYLITNKSHINTNYFVNETFNKNILFQKFISFFMKKGKKFKYLGIIYKAIRYIKLYLKQQPIVFINKSLKINSFFFDVAELHLKKKIIYIPKVINYDRQFNFTFSLIIKKM